jgi:uncharacterized protein
MAAPVGLDQSPRDRHLFSPGPKRILSLDGGGVRGAMTIAFLERLEKVVQQIEGRPTLLCDWFDIIGGTSTGAIIAGALALGYRAADIHKFYLKLGPNVFRRSFWRIAGLRAKFDARNLMKELETIIGARTLDAEDLRTGLCIVTKRLDTGSAWIVMNNPRSRFWDTPADQSFIGNRHFPLTSLLRASTAAPHYFDPQIISIVPGMESGLFVDGGVSPHNNPVLYLFMVSALPSFGLSWPMGTDKLTIVSLGTGSFRPQLRLEDVPRLRTLGIAVHALAAQISDAQQLVMTLMSWFGECPTHWIINSEMGDLGSVSSPFGRPLFRFLRYDVPLEREWLARELGVQVDEATVRKYRRMDAPENIPAIYDLAVQAAEKQMCREHFTITS